MAGRTGGGAGDAVAFPGGRRRAIPGLRPMRRPRVCLASRLPGGAGAPPGGNTAPRQELADGRADGARSAGEVPDEKRGPAPVMVHHGDRRVERREAPLRSVNPERERPVSAFPGGGSTSATGGHGPQAPSGAPLPSRL